MLSKYTEKFMNNFVRDDLKNTENISFLNCLPFIIWVKNLEGKIIFGNEKFYDFFEINSIIKINDVDILEYLPSELADLNNNTRSKKFTNSYEVVFASINNKKKLLEVHEDTFKDSNGNIIGTIFLAHEILENIVNENNQVRLKNQLKALIKILTNPMDNISTDELISMTVQTIFDFFSEYRVSYLIIDNERIIIKHSVEPKNSSSISASETDIPELKSYLSYLQIQGFLSYDNVQAEKFEQISPIFVEYPVRSLVDVPIHFEHDVVAILRIDTEVPHHWLDDEIQSFAEIGKNLSIIIQRNIYRQQMIEYEKSLIENYSKLEQYALELKDLKELYENRCEELFLNRELLEDQAFSINMLNQQLIEKEEKITESNKQLEHALSERDRFFSIIAHDLRGPLSSFLGMTKIINEQSEQFTKDELVEISGLINKNAETLYSLIENLLNWSRLKRDVIIPEPQIINIKTSTDFAVSIFKKALTNKNIDLIDKVQSNHVVYSDLNMFESVIKNLLSNAIKFTPKNGKIFLESYEVDNNYIGISIIDTGIGMSEELVSKLFKIDEKVSRTGTEGEPSTGLGLILCKELIEKNEGRLNVVSSEGIGSKFEIILPKKSVFEEIID